MEFVKVEITLPETVEKIYNMITLIDQNAFIAGGFVFDQYTNYPFKDVDIFVDEEKIRACLQALPSSGIPYHSLVDEYSIFSLGMTNAYQITYDGIVFQLISQTTGTEILHYFDICFRECYYQNGEAFISKRALQDIEKRELNVGIIHDVIKTIARLAKFKNKYGYSVSDEACERLMHFLHHNRWNKEKAFQRIKILFPDEEIKETAFSILEECEKIEINPVKMKIISFLLKERIPLKRDNFEFLYNHPEKIKKECTYTLPEDLFLNKIVEIEKEIIQYVKNNAVRLVMLFPEQAKKWRELIEDKTYFYTIFKKELDNILKKQKLTKEQFDLINEMKELFKKQKQYIQEEKRFPTTLSLRVSTSESLFFNMDAVKYLNDHYLFIEFQNLEEGFFDKKNYLIYDLEEEMLVHCPNNFVLEILQPYVKDIVKTIL